MTNSLAPAAPARAAPLGLKRLIRSSGLVIAARIAGVAIGILTQLMLARMLSAADLGVFFMAMSLAMVLSVLCSLGYPMMLPGIAAQEAGSGGAGKQRQFMRHALRDTLFLSTVLLIPCLLAIALWPTLGEAGRFSLAAGALSAPLLAVLRLNGGLANAHRRFTLGFVPDLVVRPLLLMMFTGLVWLAMPQAGIGTIVAAHLPIAALVVYWQRRKIAEAGLTGPARAGNRPAPTGFERRLWRRQGLGMLAAMLFIAVFADLDVLIAGTMLDAADTGIFGVCLKMSMIAAFAVQAVHQLIMRDAADAIAAGDRAGLRNVVARANRLNMAMSAAALIGSAVLGEQVLAVFGDEFRRGHGCLVLLMAAQALRALFGPVAQLAALTGQERACLPVSLAALAVLFAGNLVLIPLFGLAGAALAVGIAGTAWAGGLALILIRRGAINPAVLRG